MKSRRNPGLVVAAVTALILASYGSFAAASASFRGTSRVAPSPGLKPKITPPQGLGDPEARHAWYFKTIGLEAAWQLSRGNPDALIAFVDSGIDYNHPEIAWNVRWKASEARSNGIDDDRNGFVDDLIGWDFDREMRLPFDESAHGTFLSVIAAGVADNGLGSAGICPRCSILPARFMDADGLGDTEDAIRALRYSVTEGARIINFSFAGEGYDKDLEEAIQFADQHDALVVVAASNDGLDNDQEEIYPAKFNLPNLITVAASTRQDTLWADSNWGKKSVHIAAPGDDIWSLWEGAFEPGSGTSDAAALVSGAAGILLSINPELTGRELKQILMNTARRVPALRSRLITGGILDLQAAALCARDPRICLKPSPGLGRP